jgi:hypothetical protein
VTSAGALNIERVSMVDPMPRYEPVDRSPRFLAVVLSEQIQPGAFEFALDHLVEHELDLTALDAKFNNDLTGASAYARFITHLHKVKLPNFVASVFRVPVHYFAAICGGAPLAVIRQYIEQQQPPH